MSEKCNDCKHFIMLPRIVDSVDGLCGEENQEMRDSGVAYLRDSSFEACSSFQPKSNNTLKRHKSFKNE